jgi:predicted metal-dependent HD superfamily phosphohydrolase
VTKKQTTKERNREAFDTELALTNDMLAIAQRLAVYGGWRTAVRACYYVVMRISSDRGRKALAEFLADPGVGW